MHLKHFYHHYAAQWEEALGVCRPLWKWQLVIGWWLLEEWSTDCLSMPPEDAQRVVARIVTETTNQFAVTRMGYPQCDTEPLDWMY